VPNAGGSGGSGGAACVTEAQAFGTGGEAQVLGAFQACNDACQADPTSAACKAACTGAAAPPPPNSTCAPFDSHELAACTLKSIPASPTVCTSNADCSNGLVCGRFFACRCAAGQTCDPTAKCESTNADPTQLGSGLVCGTPSDSCPLNNDPNFPAVCADTNLCDPAPAQTINTITAAGDMTPAPFDPQATFGSPDAPVTTPYPDESTPCPSGACNLGQSHPWCTLGTANQPTARPSVQPNKSGKTDGSLVDFVFDPEFELDHHASFGPFGLPNLGLTAKAGVTASVDFNLPKPIPSTSVDILEANAELDASQCGVTSQAKLFVLGTDFLPLVAGDLTLPLNFPGTALTAKCQAAYDEVQNAANRAKKALRDVLDLEKQYKNLIKDDVNGVDTLKNNLSKGICNQLVGDRPRGFPAGNCGTETPEATINRFAQYYQRTITGFAGTAEAAEGAIGLPEAVNQLIANAYTDRDHSFTLYSFNHDEDITVEQVQFFIGPIPVNLELDVTTHYGATIGATLNFDPASVIQTALTSTTQQAAQPIASVEVTGAPNANAGISLFAGVGFGVAGFTAKIGVEAALSLGTITVPAYAGAGIGLGTEPDHRDLPPDMVPFATGQDLIPRKSYVATLTYNAGLQVQLSGILDGSVSAKLKIKIAFFSKTWRKQLLSFTGICTPAHPKPFCTTTLVSIGGSTDVAGGSFPWASVAPEIPFPMIAPINTPAPAGLTNLVDTSQAEKYFYDSQCSCIDGAVPTDTRECFRNGDCCPDTPTCFSNPQTKKHQCIVCEARGQVCNQDTDCCGNANHNSLCISGTCQGQRDCSELCSRDDECQSPLSCVFNPNTGKTTCDGDRCDVQ
jgi:hypothetical protein